MRDYFKDSEFKCPCCGCMIIDKELRERLNIARGIAGVPFRINSGYRCAKHNKEVGGVSTSAHTKGKAVDIRASDSITRWKVLEGVFAAGFTRVGIAKNFIHVDVDEDLPQEVSWLYS